MNERIVRAMDACRLDHADRLRDDDEQASLETALDIFRSIADSFGISEFRDEAFVTGVVLAGSYAVMLDDALETAPGETPKPGAVGAATIEDLDTLVRPSRPRPTRTHLRGAGGTSDRCSDARDGNNSDPRHDRGPRVRRSGDQTPRATSDRADLRRRRGAQNRWRPDQDGRRSGQDQRQVAAWRVVRRQPSKVLGERRES